MTYDLITDFDLLKNSKIKKYILYSTQYSNIPLFHYSSAYIGESLLFMRHNIHFIGIGGAGMVGLALIMHGKGHSVSGSDMTESANTELLLKKKIPVTIGHSPENIPKLPSEELLVVRSSAISDDNPEFTTAVNGKYNCIKRGEMLAEIAGMYTKTIAVSGSHGKTSVTALLVHILKSSGLNPGYMIGGKVCDWESPAAAGNGNIFITESDESDGTQVHLKSNILLITNIEDDHSWTVGGSDKLFANFAKIAENSEKLIFNSSESTEKLFAFHKNKKSLTFDNEFCADKNDWGDFQKENAKLAVEGAVTLGIDRITAICEVRKFPGVDRRMTLRYQQKDFILIEDYAHHPTEVKAAISTLKNRFPKYHLKIIFQPHRYARLEKYIDEFACELRKADAVKVVPVFSAWTESGSLNSADLVEKIGTKATYSDKTWHSIALDVITEIKYPEVLAVLGAGDVEKIIPELLSKLPS